MSSPEPGPTFALIGVAARELLEHGPEHAPDHAEAAVLYDMLTRELDRRAQAKWTAMP